MRILRTSSLLSLALLLIAPSAVLAADAAAGPGGFAAGFLTPVVVIEQGEDVTFHNADVAQHDFVADGVFLSPKAAKKQQWCSGFEKKKCPLFWSPKAALGESVEVLGLENVESGKQYPFFCSVHPGMKGTLVVR